MSNRNKQPYILGLDLDSTTADYTSALRNFVMARDGLTAEQLPEPINYSFVKSGWPFPTMADFLDTHVDAVLNHGLFREVQPFEGASEALHELKDHGVHIHVVTHRLLKKGTYRKVSEDTGFWLDKHNIPYHSLTFTGKKDLIRVDSFLDDAPSNIHAIREAGMKVFTYDQLYNRDIPGDRVHSWTDDVVEKVLAHKAELGL